MGNGKLHKLRMMRSALSLAVVLLAGGLMACQTLGQAANANAASGIPEMQSPDWAKLRQYVTDYDNNRGGMENGATLVIQQNFLKIYDNHAHDRIGDEALFFFGRISYDLRDYHTARVTFTKHREQFRASEFTPTITALEAEMDRNEVEYRQWLENSRGSASNR